MHNSVSASYNNSYANGAFVSNIINLRLSAGYSVKKKHNFNLTGGMIKRKSKNSDTIQRFSEYTVTLGYNYNF
jgi:hypothetical protein